MPYVDLLHHIYYYMYTFCTFAITNLRCFNTTLTIFLFTITFILVFDVLLPTVLVFHFNTVFSNSAFIALLSNCCFVFTFIRRQVMYIQGTY